MPTTKATDTLYLRLPPRLATSDVVPTTERVRVEHLPLALALAISGQPLRIATASLSELSPRVTQVSQVVLLLAASDVTLLRLAVPPLPATRLRAALTSLIEAFVISEATECAVAAGPEVHGQRLIAICDSIWLSRWVDALRATGARRIRVLPISLCLPNLQPQLSAALFQYSSRYELALRLSEYEAIGLPVEADDETQLPAAVNQILDAFAPQRPVYLSVPKQHITIFSESIQTQGQRDTKLIDQHWSDYISASAQLAIDLIAALDDRQRMTFPWREWRWPIALAAAVSLFNIGALHADWWQLRSEGVQLRDQMADIYQRSFPGEAIVLDPLAQMKQNMTAARQASGQVDPSDFLILAAELGDVWHAAGHDPRAIDTLDYRDGMLNIKLKKTAQLSITALKVPLAVHRLQLRPSSTDPLLWKLTRS